MSQLNKNQCLDSIATDKIVAVMSTDLEYRVEIISDFKKLLDLQSVWDQLVVDSGIHHPFLHHDWICTWWECFGAEKNLYILLVKVGDAIVGIAPLMRSEERIYGLRVRCLNSFYNSHTPRFDFILKQGSEDVYRSIWNHLSSVADEWDILNISQLSADSRTLGMISRLSKNDNYLIGLWHGEQSPYVSFNGAWDGFVRRLNRKHRANIRNRLNRLTKIGEVRLEVIPAGEGNLTGALDEGFQIEAAAWKLKTGTAISCTPDVEKFYRVFANRAVYKGTLRLLFMTVGGIRIAFAYALCYSNKLYVLKTGYDPAYAQYSPYNLLCYLVFKYGYEHGLDEYEFLGNNEAWKLDWTREIRSHKWLFVLAPRWHMYLIYCAKFQWIPILQRQRLYVFIRDIFFGPNRRIRRRLMPARLIVRVSDNSHLPQAPG